MRIFKIIEYTYSKKDSVINLLDRTGTVLSDLQQESVNCLFYISDHSGGYAPAVEKAVKKFPELKKYEFAVSGNIEEPVQYKLSNLPHGIRPENPNGVTESLDFSLLHDIAIKIPRPFHFDEAEFYFDGIDWFKNGAANEKPAIITSPWLYCLYSSSIIISSNWGFYHRYNGIQARVELDVPDSNAVSLPEFDSETKEILMKLGKIKSETVKSIPNQEEQELLLELNKKAEHTIGKYKEMMPTIIRGIFPHCDIPSKRDLLVPYYRIEIKKHIINTFKKRGYIYKSNLSEFAVYYTIKRTKSNNQIKLYFETGKYHSELSCKFIYQGALWSQEIEVPTTIGGIFYQIDNPLVEKLFDNIAAVVDYLENVLVKELDEIYGETPRWYEYQK